MADRSPTALCWIRRDLRLSDHAALAAATAAHPSVAVVFVFDRNILDALEDRADRRVTFIHRSLAELDAKLRAVGSQLIVRHGDPQHEIPALAAALGVKAVYTARDYEPYAVTRDLAVRRDLQAQGIAFETVVDSVVIEPGQVLSQSGTPFRVYSPFARAWRKALRAEHTAIHAPNLAHFAPTDAISARSVDWSMSALGFTPTELWLEPGEDAANARLDEFRPRIAQYAESRDFPAKPGTSGLSVHLRFGTISIRELVRRAQEQGDSGDKWLAELIWRDFYQDLLWHHPQVVTECFQPQFNDLQWPGEESHWRAWCEGQTGFPIVDAAMRCLNATGWMHNRLRMIVASFLTKDLLIDYRRGEAYFAAKLLDFELASNNGGWQWAASTGADAQPYFRIFNPVLQSERFDPDGAFIRTWCPELAGLSGKAVHWPAGASAMELETASLTLGKQFPKPIVNHALQKDRAIGLLASVAKRKPSEA
ncbi:MAG: deoxyribodipyrimidine photo-lyase [Fimbriimonadaceae bacterium]|nr:deoxyribodipyrimidine photo-lyase [Fimbriimonadaceae bacterium]